MVWHDSASFDKLRPAGFIASKFVTHAFDSVDRMVYCFLCLVRATLR
jgi:hypothetical protein